ncbi:MAG: exodeoxyribonuclease VII small subunit [Anaerolineaceae bacterium]
MTENQSNPNQDVQNLSYEQAFDELEVILRQLENEQANLDETLRLFERGKALVDRCSELLDAADLRLHVLSETGDELEPDGEFDD